jgi:hypothetical protein
MLDNLSDEVTIYPGRQATSETLGGEDVLANNIRQGRDEAGIRIDAAFQEPLQCPGLVVLDCPDETILPGAQAHAADVVVQLREHAGAQATAALRQSRDRAESAVSQEVFGDLACELRGEALHRSVCHPPGTMRGARMQRGFLKDEMSC